MPAKAKMPGRSKAAKKPLRPRESVISHAATSKGIAMGEPFIIKQMGASIPKHWISDKELPGEITRFKQAIHKSKNQLAKIKEKLCRFHDNDQIQILDTHTLILQDETILNSTIEHISNSKINAEWALEKSITNLKMAFADVREQYFIERKNDIDYISQRILKNLLGTLEHAHTYPSKEVIVVANDLSPADIASLPRNWVKGFITATGGTTSHTAIIARSFEIPAMIGVDDAINRMKNAQYVIIDGINGRIILNPTTATKAKYRRKLEGYQKTERSLLKEIHLPATTIDGKHISIHANIELVEEVPSVIEHGGEGVGLFRTEYLYINRLEYPSEEEQFETYRSALKQMWPKPVTIRTLDIGGDKLFITTEYQEHVNPALGLRAIRFCLREQELFKAQLRALYRASPSGKLRILLPMIASVEEVRQTKKLIEEVKQELTAANKPFDDTVKLGIMIEVPSAVLIADILAKEVDFFSIGTNDLIQYGLAVDRTNENVSYMYTPLHPAVMRMIKQTVDAAKNANIDVTICGEIAADPLYTLLLLAFGLDAMSMNATSIPRAKRIIRSIEHKRAASLLNRIMQSSTVEESEQIMKAEVGSILAKLKI